LRIEAQEQKLLVEEKDQGQDDRCEKEDEQHIALCHRQDVSEEVAVEIAGVALGQCEQHYSQSHSRGHEYTDGRVLGDAGPGAGKAYAYGSKDRRSYAEGQWIIAQKVAQANAPEGSMGYAVADEYNPIQNYIDSDYAAKSRSREAGQQGISHELIG